MKTLLSLLPMALLAGACIEPTDPGTAATQSEGGWQFFDEPPPGWTCIQKPDGYWCAPPEESFPDDGAGVGTTVEQTVAPDDGSGEQTTVVPDDGGDQGAPECSMCGPHTPGFWSQQCGQTPAAKFDAVELAAITAEAAELSITFGSGDEVCGWVLEYTPSDPREKLLHHLATLTLNLASGIVTAETALDSDVAATVGEAYALIEAAAAGQGPLSYEAAKDLADAIDNGVGVDLETLCGACEPE